MGKLAWILGVTFTGAALYVLLSERQFGQPVEEFGERASLWGIGKRIVGAGGAVGGRIEQGAGKLTGDQGLQADGVLDEAAGRVKGAAGEAAQAVGSAVSELTQ